ncbi:threonine synthase [Basilea psittacipulmonis]|uniref:Threonine synthase n=1 Tax=Basilea psittacipulmonis DSM 24701 TaxID=1072685 RepID=A0A077DH65_9BURK|nr:threonine synthase [Basilea psittacipulmonis]AIL32792.1 threonine synthase [Basilea psittacipulmonis DSM 24701]
MNYISTRGQAKGQQFCDILLEGLATDGGLMMPEKIPTVTASLLESWRGLDYPSLATEILSLYISDIPKHTLAELLNNTYQAKVFNASSTSEMVPLKKLSHGIFLLGLSEGPTLAFKDMAMQFLGHIFEYVLTQKNEQINILGATSGDTGSAAEHALKGKKGVNVFMLSPYGRMSDFQRAQMYSLTDKNIFNIAIKGVFDDCQDIVKTLSGHDQTRQELKLGAVNSINWARIAAQIVYYFWGWLRATDATGAKEVSFCVPSGNFGNIFAGFMARQMGLPIRRLVLATNENNVLDEFFKTGIYRTRSSAQTYATSSPSMDISKASNFERFVFELLDRDSTKLTNLWNKLSTEGYFDLSSYRPLFESKYGFQSDSSTHADRIQTIQTVWNEDKVMIDPHTADGVKVARHYLEKDVPMLVLETALPIKFAATIQEAIGVQVPYPEHLKHLLDLPQKVDVLNNNAQDVKAYMEKHLFG